MADLMAKGMAFFNAKRKASFSRTVTYRSLRNGSIVTADVLASLANAQLANINALSNQPDQEGFNVPDAIQVNRGYVVGIQDLRDVGLWPPQANDYIDDTNDEDGVTKRYQVSSIQGAEAWRLLAGAYQVMAVVHTQFFQDVSTYWDDEFSGAGSLASHTADTGGTYSGGSGTLTISADDVLTSGTVPAFTYFDPAHLDILASVNFAFNLTPTELSGGKYAEMGIGVRCATTGSDKREGYYCTVRLGYTDGAQSPSQLRIVRRRNGTNTTLTSVDIPVPLSLGGNHVLTVQNVPTQVTFTLFDSTGLVPLASTSIASTIINSNTGCAITFDHNGLADCTKPWLDHLTVEAT